MALTKEVMEELDKLAAEEDAKEAAEREKMREWHKTPAAKAIWEQAEKDIADEDAQNAKNS